MRALGNCQQCGEMRPCNCDAARLADEPAAPTLAAAIASRYAKPLVVARAAMQEFVDRMDRGEVRSKRSYATFKAALAEIEAAFPELAQ